MPIVQTILALIVLSLLYARMTKREVPEPMPRSQAIVPIIFGVVSLPLSFMIFLGIGFLLTEIGYSSEGLPTVVRSFNAALFGAGIPEETAKLLIIAVSLLIFRSKLRNVYEYILVGAAVGFGFTVFEEFLYGSDSMVSDIGRLVTIAGHVIFGILMGKHLGLARYCKTSGNGSSALQYILAYIVPLVIHTLYDACLLNKFQESEDEDLAAIGIVIAIVAFVVFFIFQLIALSKMKKNTGKYCEMGFDAQAAE